MRHFVTFLCFGLIAILITACGGGEQTADTDYYLNASEETRALYEASCIYCHASDLSGQVGPASNIQQVGSRLNKDEIISVIENGRGQMTPFKDKLSAEEIESLADWLVTLK